MTTEGDNLSIEATSDLSDRLGTWIPLEKEKPPRCVDVLILDAEGRMWVGAFCDWETCDELHWQSDGYDVNYIPNPKYWMVLPSPPAA